MCNSAPMNLFRVDLSNQYPGMEIIEKLEAQNNKTIAGQERNLANKEAHHQKVCSHKYFIDIYIYIFPLVPPKGQMPSE